MITIRIERYQETLNLIDTATKRLKDLSPAWREIADYLHKEVITKSWDTYGSIMGKRWPALSPKYRAWKDKNYPGRHMLVLTGDMKTAATGGSGSVLDIKPKEMVIGIDTDYIPYARVHQYGYKKIPQRPYFFSADGTLPGRAIQKIINVIKKRINEES